MSVELGHFCLILAWTVALLQATCPFPRKGALAGLTIPLASLQWIFTTLAFLTLLLAYAHSDFSALNVFLNSHSAKPFIYKLTATWGNHEGSFLLWVWLLSTFGFILSFAARTPERRTALAVMGALSFLFCTYILFASNPFLRLSPTPPDGQGLNPLLQDIGLAIHPPLLYIGYVGFAVPFAYAVAGLIHGSMNKEWARKLQPWSVFSWGMLTFGIGLGSWWAYRELGWGGFWFWDPVENVSLLPWLSGLALIHSIRVLQVTGRFAGWIYFLAVFTFAMSLIGTFIVRSGLLMSVHSFASDPTRGIFILLLFAIITGAALALLAWRTLPNAQYSHPLRWVSRSGFILINNWFLLTACLTIVLAMLYPLLLLLLELPTVTLGPGYYNQTILPLMAVLAVLAGIVLGLSWPSANLRQCWRITRLPLAIAVSIVVAVAWHRIALDWYYTAGLALGCWLIAGTMQAGLRAQRNKSLTRRYIATLMAHGGFGLLILAISWNAAGQLQQEYVMQIGQTESFGVFDITMTEFDRAPRENYLSQYATFTVERDGQHIAELTPEVRHFPIRETQTTEAAIHSTLWRDLYIVIGEAPYHNGLGVRAYYKPGMLWIWISILLLGSAGLLAMQHRKADTQT